jgi:hypothetical protein
MIPVKNVILAGLESPMLYSTHAKPRFHAAKNEKAYIPKSERMVHS